MYNVHFVNDDNVDDDDDDDIIILYSDSRSALQTSFLFPLLQIALECVRMEVLWIQCPAHVPV